MNIAVFVLQRDLPQDFLLRFRRFSGNIDLMAPKQTAGIIKAPGRIMVSRNDKNRNRRHYP